jgi:indole-3-glycerol phosphate synthase
MSLLEQIIATKRQEIAAAKVTTPLEVLRQRIDQLPRIEHRMIKTGHLQLIAEIKAKSPSKGLIRGDFDPVALARDFTAHGAAAISVLTDRDYFGGSLDMLRLVRAATPLPLLRKDFIIDPYQIYETKDAGADIILLIIRAVGSELAELVRLSVSLGLQVLIEAHGAEELGAALESIQPSPQIMIGINNRDLDTFATNIQTSVKLIKTIPPQFVRISESGLTTTEDLSLMEQIGFDAALIGEGLALDPELVNYFNAHEDS